MTYEEWLLLTELRNYHYWRAGNLNRKKDLKHHKIMGLLDKIRADYMNTVIWEFPRKEKT